MLLTRKRPTFNKAQQKVSVKVVKETRRKKNNLHSSWHTQQWTFNETTPLFILHQIELSEWKRLKLSLEMEKFELLTKRICFPLRCNFNLQQNQPKIYFASAFFDQQSSTTVLLHVFNWWWRHLPSSVPLIASLGRVLKHCFIEFAGKFCSNQLLHWANFRRLLHASSQVPPIDNEKSSNCFAGSSRGCKRRVIFGKHKRCILHSY